MTDRKRDGTRERLLAAAEEEFLSLGYEKAGLRGICRRAGVTTGALYFFFPDKAGLFRELVGRVPGELEGLMAEASKREREESLRARAAGVQPDSLADRDNERRLMEYIFKNRSAFLLLLGRAEGSEFEGFAKSLKDWVKGQFMEFAAIFLPKEARDSEDFCLMAELMAQWRFQSYMRILEESASAGEAVRRAELVSAYAVGGWNELIKVMRGGEEK